jgi:DNA mismatch repair protein MutS
MTIIRHYLDLQKKYTKIYGSKTIVLMQVGSFHESYSIPDEGYNLFELSNLLNLTCTKKNKSIVNVTINNPYLLGFPSVALAKYLKILIDNGYTVIIFDQYIKSINGDIERKLTGIYSGGTYISETPSADMNYLVSIYMVEEIGLKNKPTLNVGITWVDVSTGTSTLHECHGSSVDEYYGLDEVLRIIKSYNPREIIIHYHANSNPNLNTNAGQNKMILDKEDISRYLEIDNFHYVLYSNDKSKNLFLKPESFKINYQNEILSNVFNLENQLTLNKSLSPLEVLDLESKPYGTISLMILLEFIKNHNENLLRNLSAPNIYMHQKYLILGNNAIQQLNVIDRNNLDSYQKQFQSLFDVINKTKTAMGQRYLKENLLNPLSQLNKQKIQLRYQCIDAILSENLCEKITDYLNNISDLERLHRKMGIQMLHPIELCALDNSYQYVIKIIKTIYNSKIKNTILQLIPNDLNIIKEQLLEFMNEYKTRYQLDIANEYHLNDIAGSFYSTGIYNKIDKLQEEINLSWNMIKKTANYFSNLLTSTSNSNSNSSSNSPSKNNSMVSIIHNETNGYFLSITKNRAELLKRKLKEIKNPKISLKDIEFKNLPKGNTRIFIKNVIEHSDNLIEKKSKMVKLIKKYYLQDLNMFYDKYQLLFNRLVNFISEIDFINSGAISAKMYHYNMPCIKSKENIGSYIKCTKLRHPIVERINKEFEYIPNDIILGNIDNRNGTLLFSINGCGKSVFMKSIGLSLIMAQIGYFVPAETFEYEPYMALYARITGNDNFLKGLSSFTLEMTELQAIIKRTCDNGLNTIVIGDEICRGTEIISGTAIVASTLITLSKCNSTFIFSTHLHQIPKLEEIKALTNLKSYHMRVEYDTENDCLVFDRKLCPGPGPEVYGLLVAKYLIKNSEFVNQAESIKRKLIENMAITNTSASLIKIPEPRKSKFNNIIFMTKCAICFYKPVTDVQKELETHHIHFQKDCLEDGKIIQKPYLHKNHMSNLVVVCRKCHEKIHRGSIIIKEHLQTSKGIIVNYDIVHDFNK